jgi:hypothetical protein
MDILPCAAPWVPAPMLATELSRRTLARRFLDPKLQFPRARCIKQRLYFDRASIEAWKAH